VVAWKAMWQEDPFKTDLDIDGNGIVTGKDLLDLKILIVRSKDDNN
jgi:hypothetical protein